MEIFDIGIKILLALNFLFFLIFFYLCQGWAKPKQPDDHIAIGIFLSIFYGFLFFLGGLALLLVIIFIYKYFPSFIKFIKETWKF